MAFCLKLPTHWQIHNVFLVSLLNTNKAKPHTQPVLEDPPDIDHDEEILQPKMSLQHEDKLLCSGKSLRKYPIKFKNYTYENFIWMQETQL